jgi:inner membrane protein
MPSPLGHALGGLAAGWIVGGNGGEKDPHGLHRPRSGVRQSVAYGAAALAPDLDLLFGTHSTYTHSIGAILLAFAVAAIASKGRFRFAAGVAAAWASHVLLDWLGSDSSAPIGVMALWPFSTEHYESSLHAFDAISRRYWMGWVFVMQNAKAMARELLILGPIASAAYWLAWLRRRRTGQSRIDGRESVPGSH